MTTRKNVDRQQQLRDVLRQSPDGLSEALLHAYLKTTMGDGYNYRTLRASLYGMDDAYIKSWAHHPRLLRYVPVWAVVPVPDDAPMPTRAPPSREVFNKVIQRSASTSDAAKKGKS